MEHHHSARELGRTREPGTEQQTGLLTREQQQYAAEQIDRGIETATRSVSAIDASTARLIAACLHSGRGSHLEHFAATGDLNPHAALDEIDGGKAQLDQLTWVAALWDFLERIEAPEPDVVEVEHAEPHPQVFVQPLDETGNPLPGGRWLHADVFSVDLREQIEDLLSVARSQDWFISASVGFHGYPLETRPNLRELSLLAREITSHGEAYALYARHAGHLVDNHAFRIRYQGSYDSMTEFIATIPEDSLQYALDSTDPASDPNRTHALDNFEDVLRRNYLCLEGREGIHVFHTQYGVATKPIWRDQ